MGKRRFRFNWGVFLYVVYLLAGISGLVLLMGTVNIKSSEQACTEMRILIEGEDAFVEQKDVQQLMESAYGQLVGRTLVSLPIHQIEKDLKQIPYVSHAKVSMDMNGLLSIRIQQRKAVLRVVDSLGAGFYVDEQRLKMPLTSRYIPKVSLANGHIMESLGQPLDTLSSVLVNDLFAIASFIKDNPIWEKQIVQLYVNDQSDIELIPRSGDYRIIFGSGKDLQEKFEKLMIYYQGVVPKMGIEAYSVVNLKYKDQLVCLQNRDLPKEPLHVEMQDTLKLLVDSNKQALDTLIKLDNNILDIQ